MANSAAGIRSVIRSASTFRSTAARFVHEAKPKSSPSPSTFGFAKKNPFSQRILRSSIPMSVDSLMPFHSANSSALLVSKLGVSSQFSWLLEASIDDA